MSDQSTGSPPRRQTPARGPRFTRPPRRCYNVPDVRLPRPPRACPDGPPGTDHPPRDADPTEARTFRFLELAPPRDRPGGPRPRGRPAARGSLDPRGARPLGLPADRAARGPLGPGAGPGPQPDRRLPRGGAGRGRPRRRRPRPTGDPHPPPQLRPDGAAARPGRGRGVRRRRPARRLRAAGRSPAGVARLRRALGDGTGSTWPATPTRRGSSSTTDRPDAWRYRDWVIDALNADMPYDRFVAAPARRRRDRTREARPPAGARLPPQRAVGRQREEREGADGRARRRGQHDRRASSSA